MRILELNYFRPYLQYCRCENPRGRLQLILFLYFNDHRFFDFLLLFLRLAVLFIGFFFFLKFSVWTMLGSTKVGTIRFLGFTDILREKERKR